MSQQGYRHNANHPVHHRKFLQQQQARGGDPDQQRRSRESRRGPGSHEGSAPAMWGHELPGLPGFEEMADRYTVTGQRWEIIRTALFDSAVYPAGGTPQLTFFTVQKGQGVGFGGNAKTLSDTNMTLSGQIPMNQSFLIKTIEVDFQPTTPTVAAQLPAAFGTGAAMQLVNDGYVFRRSGNLVLLIGSKNYLEEAPLNKFPAQTTFQPTGTTVADATTPAAAQQSRIGMPNTLGRPYHISPADLRLEANMNFNLTLNWPEGLQALPSGNPARVFVRLDGLLYRKAQ